jgi:hypothetical protein
MDAVRDALQVRPVGNPLASGGPAVGSGPPTLQGGVTIFTTFIGFGGWNDPIMI